MSRLIILRGNSGSGKTTVARAMQQRLGPNTLLLSHDMVRMEMLHVWGEEGVRRSLPLMAELLRFGRRNSPYTIMEGILPFEQYRELFETALREFGSGIFAYYYDIPFEETLRRHATKPNCGDFGEPEMRRWWREKDLLPIIPETILREDVSLDAAIELIYGQVTG